MMLKDPTKWIDMTHDTDCTFDCDNTSVQYIKVHITGVTYLYNTLG